jgi:hypothetical protein
MTIISPPRHITWSTDLFDLADPFQRNWYMRQIIEHGKAQDVAGLDLDELARLLDKLNLPPYLHSLSARFLEPRHVAR